ncbi:competence/damage-inducible protein A [Odoribacter sp. Z80]|uniref:competence/damage-inducible protein A n=1 Tax=Odoribacter sp. Z80 TaxID=2304575 RepID=UPI0013798576|nr:competence/damage-inducible protein A [Odoribacter sp. Z80]NCE71394.1 competence/damage-inducible protein A [Odoribacter sp. Z80]
MNAIIITIGDEILMGQILDTNSQYIARRLTEIGVEVTEELSIPDKREEIYETVDYAMQEADLIFVTGGLGPTKDDVTKKVLAEYFGSRLVFNPQAMEWLEELLRNRNLPMNENNKSQAFLPDNCRLLRNFKGTASGMWFERGWKSLISMPGVPFEMEHLMDMYVVPELKAKYSHLQLEYRMLKVYDVAESQLAHHLEMWEDALPDGLKLAYLPSPGMVKLRVTAKGEGIKQLEERYESLKEVLAGMRYTEGDDALEKQMGKVLRKKGMTIATAESCTGGEIARLITSVPGSSEYFKGTVVAYANDVKIRVLGVAAEDIEKEGAVSEKVVLQMAEGVRKLMQANYAVSTSGVAGPDGGTPEKPVGTVWIGIATPKRTFARKFVFSFTRERNIAKAAAKALELLMLEVENVEK